MMSMSSVVQFSGRYRLQVFHGDTDILLQDTGWFNNLITDRGMDLLGLGHAGNCYVGSNLTPLDPAVSAITGVLGVQESAYDVYGNQISVLPYYGYVQRTYVYGIGAIQGTIRELGIGNTADDLFSHAHLTNTQGQTITITLGGIDRLNLIYELRQYIPTDDFPVSFTVNGITQTGTARPGEIDIPYMWALAPGKPVGFKESYSGVITVYFKPHLYIDSTGLGPLTGIPTGTKVPTNTDGAPASTVATYVSGSYKRSISTIWGNDSITMTNINAMFVGLETRNPFVGQHYCSTGLWQMYFSPGFTRSFYQTFTFNWEISWQRYVP